MFGFFSFLLEQITGLLVASLFQLKEGTPNNTQATRLSLDNAKFNVRTHSAEPAKPWSQLGGLRQMHEPLTGTLPSGIDGAGEREDPTL